MLKLPIIVVCYIVLLLVESGVAKNMEVGARQDGDRMVLMEHVVVKARYFGRVEEEKDYQVPVGYTITLVKSVDMVRDGTGAEAAVVQGGPGTDKVKLRLKMYDRDICQGCLDV